MAPASSTVEGPVATLDVPSAMASAAIGYGIVLPFAVYLHDYLAVAYPLADGVNGSMEEMHNIGWFILAYVSFLFVGRIIDAGWHNLYEMLWACNVAMVLAGYGIVTDRPRLVGACWVMVSLDQTLWYIEIAFRLYRGKNHPRPWIIGVAKYLDAPETTRVKFWTAWHHLWFFPLIVYTLKDHGYVPVGSYPMQVVLMTVLGNVSRALTPYQVYEPKISPTHVVYLNINLSHKFWKDIHTRSWGKVDRFFSRGWECSAGLNGRPAEDFSHIYDNETGVVGAVKYLLWANLILNVVNIAPTLVISIVLALG